MTPTVAAICYSLDRVGKRSISEDLAQRRINDRHHTIFVVYWGSGRVGLISKRMGTPAGTPGGIGISEHQGNWAASPAQ